MVAGIGVGVDWTGGDDVDGTGGVDDDGDVAASYWLRHVANNIHRIQSCNLTNPTWQLAIGSNSVKVHVELYDWPEHVNRRLGLKEKRLSRSNGQDWSTQKSKPLPQLTLSL
ncbi:hypothetical protein Tco_0990637 [Tanacetum coccineum]|uniref:Uncharacterized protein n=1 Tax=Tanacetum coccineum TaxID=301880 RepID=A0ABQ5EXS9_9ASTR